MLNWKEDQHLIEQKQELFHPRVTVLFLSCRRRYFLKTGWKEGFPLCSPGSVQENAGLLSRSLCCLFVCLCFSPKYVF